eukprot:Nk52_evm16s239 gene=Nk52_evmTU16s239
METLKSLLTKSSCHSMECKEFAEFLDAHDELRHLRDEYFIPPMTAKGGKSKDSIYMCGNSLGLMPKNTEEAVKTEMEKWKNVGVEGHFTGEYPWVSIGELPVENMAKVVGASPEEVVLMNTLTVNLHLMMISFYRPSEKRFKVIMEDKAFPSDHYAVESQVRFHGYEPEEAIVYAKPRDGEFTLRTEDILELISSHGDSVALVMFSGIQYYTGQFFDIPTITKAGHDVGAQVGWDLAHAAGNLPLYLNEWDVDFGCWCTYKYLNSGAGGVGGVFVHKKHHEAFNSYEGKTDKPLPKLTGWWGHQLTSRFKMDNKFVGIMGAQSWAMSNPPMIPCVCLISSLKVFSKTSMEELRKKSVLLTQYLEHLILTQVGEDSVKIITPRDPEKRGSQLSLYFSMPVKQIFDKLTEQGVIGDMREPNVMRVAPTAMYNSFTDVFNFVALLKGTLP